MLCECHFRYADRAKSIAVKATKNEEGMEVEKLNKEIEALKRKVQAAVHSTSFYLILPWHERRGVPHRGVLCVHSCVTKVVTSSLLVKRQRWKPSTRTS